MARRRPLPLRFHLLGIVLVGAVLPLTLIGFLLTRSAARAGERLLEDQLRASLDNVAGSIAARWEHRRGNLLLLAQNENGRSALSRGMVTPADSQYFAQLAAAMEGEIPVFAYLDPNGHELYVSSPLTRSRLETGGRRTIHVSYPISSAEGGGVVLGSLEAQVDREAILPMNYEQMLPSDGLLAIRNRAQDFVLRPLLPELAFQEDATITISDEPWMVRSFAMDEPPLDLAVAAPMAPYVQPFHRAARIGLAAVGAVALLSILLTTALTSRLSGSVRRLADAAGAVADGNLDAELKPAGPAELHELADSFNTMTESLRRLVRELAERRALAAVGEFATSLSHEVRNALTSVQIDLERVEERSEDAKNRAMLARTLTSVRRLDAVVTGALRVARSGTIQPQDIVIADVLDEAARLTQHSYDAAGARLLLPPTGSGVRVRGDADGLRQLLLNLLLNAQQWSSPGGETRVSVTAEASRVVVTISDTGRGMTDEQVSRAFEPYYTTRDGGTGLGLPIARQIALAHGGELTIRSTVGAGTTVQLELPVASAVAEVV